MTGRVTGGVTAPVSHELESSGVHMTRMHRTSLVRSGVDIDLNHRTYNSPDVVLSFVLRRALQAPEARIRSLLAHRLGQMTMLDVGVGGGRTTRHFIGAVSEYVAIDYSPRMVWACRRRFSQRRDSFLVGDARAMDLFPAGRFDFVLYSYNGIDYMDHGDRMRALAEIRRVTRSGGVVCLSSHNLRAVPASRWPPFTWNPLAYLGALKHRLLLRMLNKPEVLKTLAERSHQIIRDLPRTRTYYVSPVEQLRQLKAAGFSNVRIFGLRQGEEIGDVAQAERLPDPWLHYLCDAP